MRNERFSRRSLLGGLAAAALSGSVVSGRVARAGEGDVELPREGSYIEGRKVVYIDGSAKYRTLDTPDTYNVLVEPVEITYGKGFRIVAPRVTLDGRKNLINSLIADYHTLVNSNQEDSVLVSLNASVPTEVGICVRLDNANGSEVLGGTFVGGIEASGKNLTLRGNYLKNSPFRGIELNGEGSHVLNNIFSNTHYGSLVVNGDKNFIIGNSFDRAGSEAGIKLRGNQNFLDGNTIEEVCYGFGISVSGEHNLVLNGKVIGTVDSYDVSSDSPTNVFRDCIYDAESPDSSLTRQFTFQPTFVDGNGQPIYDALVTLQRFNGDVALALRTDSDGKVAATPVTTYVSRNGIKENHAPFAGMIKTIEEKVTPFVWQGSSKMVDETIQLD